MGNNQTLVQVAVAASCFGLMAVTMGPDDQPDPRAISQELHAGATPALAAADAPRLVVAEFAFSRQAHAAPAMETQSLEPERAAVAEMAVVVGLQATHGMDRSFFEAFGAYCGDVQGQPVPCTDRDAVEMLMVGRADFGVIGGQLSAREVQAGLRQTRLGVEMFALVMAPTAPVRSLSRQQLRQIFTGQVTHWSQLGLEGGAIVAVVPSERALAERAAKVLIPGDAFATTCVGVATERHVVDQLLREPGAVGIVRLASGPHEAGQKVVQIDWNAPTLEGFECGNYPFGIPMSLVTSGQPSGIAQRLLEFANGAEGKQLLGRTLMMRP